MKASTGWSEVQRYKEQPRQVNDFQRKLHNENSFAFIIPPGLE